MGGPAIRKPRATLKRPLEPAEVVQLLRSEVERVGSQMAFAKMAGVDRATVNKILHGRRQPTEKIILALGLRRVPRVKAGIQKPRPTEELDVEDILRLLHAEVQRMGSQTAFAKIAGVDRATVHKVLRGKFLPSQKIALYYMRGRGPKWHAKHDP